MINAIKNLLYKRTDEDRYDIVCAIRKESEAGCYVDVVTIGRVNREESGFHFYAYSSLTADKFPASAQHRTMRGLLEKLKEEYRG